MHVYSPIFQGPLIEKKYIDNFNSLGAREVLKKCKKKGKKNLRNICFVLNKYQSVAHASTSIFQGLFKNKVFRSLAFVTKKLWAILNFYSPHNY